MVLLVVVVVLVVVKMGGKGNLSWLVLGERRGEGGEGGEGGRGEEIKAGASVMLSQKFLELGLEATKEEEEGGGVEEEMEEVRGQ